MTEPPDQMHVWTSPPDSLIPITRRELRLAVGTPIGASSNSWKIWVRGGHVYVKCRDNFSEFKVSLHSSGEWRFALTDEAVRARPDLRRSDGDRVLSRRTLSDGDFSTVQVGFQIIMLRHSLYLNRSHRKKWPPTVVFVEEPELETDITVLSVTVVPGRDPIKLPAGTYGIVVGLLALDADRSVQVTATQESGDNIRPLLRAAFEHTSHLRPPNVSDEAVLFTWGNRPDGVPCVTSVRHGDIQFL
jgi:hypothetical protein